MRSSAAVVALAALAASLCSPLAAGRSAPPPPVSVQTVPYQLGDSWVNITTETRGGPRLAAGAAYINVHSNENTSVVAGRAVTYYRGGSLTRLLHNDPMALATRQVSFALGGVQYAFDPNRMFTPAGAAASLATYGPSSPAAVAAVLAFSKKVLEVYGFDALDHVVALHDNAPGYSAASYLPGGPFAQDAAAVFILQGSDPESFAYTTDPAVYAALSSPAYAVNCVLQSNATVVDDGSLSYYAGLLNKSYTNVENRASGPGDSDGAAVLQQLDVIERLSSLLWD